MPRTFKPPVYGLGRRIAETRIVGYVFGSSPVGNRFADCLNASAKTVMAQGTAIRHILAMLTRLLVDSGIAR
ncbi:hypothetical protein JVX88_24210 [Leptolyngbya sp. 7M]|nr:hypothetical protein [Leptolyngbya sp. 7M]QYO68896.1 hypothetical protein JVX88_24210 [Leptolyngbya sp. 7M]